MSERMQQVRIGSSETGQRLVQQWLAASRQAERAKLALEAAQKEVETAAFAVGTWATPARTHPSEIFCFWVGLEEHQEFLLRVSHVEEKHVGMDDSFRTSHRGFRVKLSSQDDTVVLAETRCLVEV